MMSTATTVWKKLWHIESR